ncbi:MAG: lipoprotein-releasing ABC transporter permease subunit [Holosporales bacterium]|nr:lipoprotein-releasing ABC transporter permease subunit [Holosporales bacterium]
MALTSLECSVAWRYLRSKHKDGFISVIAGFSFLGIALGVATLIIVTSVMNGFRHEFMSQIIGFNGHMSLHASNGIAEYNEIANSLRKSSNQISTITALIERQAMFVTKTQVIGGVIRGLDSLQLKNLFAAKLIAGELYFDNDDKIIIGKYLANRLNVCAGDEVKIITPELSEGGFGYIPRAKTFNVVGIFSTGMYEYDNSIGFISLSYAQKLFDLPNMVTQFEITVSSPDLSNKVKAIVQKSADRYGLTVLDWQERNSAFMNAVAVERNVMFLILTLIVMVASFNIISCMVMLVREKSRAIAILRTIGMQRSSVMRIFMMAGFLIGGIGTCLGVTIGLLFSYNIEHIRKLMEYLLKTNLFSAEVYYLSRLPAEINANEALITTVIALLLSFLSTIYPAWRASRIDPAEALRYE